MQRAQIQRRDDPDRNSGDGIRPESPCIGICALDAAEVCTGCGRTLDEIACWSRLTPAGQWAVIGRLHERKARP